MKGLAVLRTAVVSVFVSLSVSACGGGASVSAPVVPLGSGAFAPSALAGGPRFPAQAGVRSAGMRNAACVPFSHPAPGLPPPCTIYVGGFISPTKNETPSQQIASEATFESQIGRHMAMAMHYYQWTDQWPGILEADDASNGRIPVVSWHCGAKDSDVVNGVWDGMLAKRAAAVAAYGRPIFIRYKWEMNLTYNEKSCADPAVDHPIPANSHRVQYDPVTFIYAWDHIRAVFAANGASNVVWLFNPSSSGIDPDLYYPGDSEVDWIGFDHYDTNNKSFQATFSDTSHTHGGRQLHTYPYFFKLHPAKPFMIGETGIIQASQPMFLSGADAALQTSFPNIQAFMYWDSTGQRGQYQLLQFGINAFAQFAAGPYEQGFYH